MSVTVPPSLVSEIRYSTFATDVMKANPGIEKNDVVRVWIGLVKNL